MNGPPGENTRKIWIPCAAVLSVGLIIVALAFPASEESTSTLGVRDAPALSNDQAQRIRFTVDSLQPNLSQITGTVSYGLTPQALANLREVSTGRRVAPDCHFVNGIAVACAVSSDEASQLIRVYEEVSNGNHSLGSPSYFQSQAVTLSQLYSAVGANEIFFVATVTLGIAGTPSHYPWDVYSTRILLKAQSQDVILPSQTIRDYETNLIPGQDASLTAKCLPRLESSIQTHSACGLDSDLAVSYEITRPGLNQAFVIGLGIALPSLLILLLIILTLVSESSFLLRSLGLKELLASFGVVAFTLLLVRPIIIPSSITTLTRIDYALAAEVILIVVWTVVFFSTRDVVKSPDHNDQEGTAPPHEAE
jgi:hypothetical protein